MIGTVVKLLALLSLLHAEEVIIFNMTSTHPDDWLSVQNDQDADLSSEKWSRIGNPFKFYTCQVSGGTQNNFLRTPFINTRTRGLKYVYVDIKFKMKSCTASREDLDRDNCDQSFHLHLKESDTANDEEAINVYTYRLANPRIRSVVPDEFGIFLTKTVPVELSGTKNGVFFAIRDTGACVTIADIRVRYRYCADQVKDAVRYNSTTLDGADIQIQGQCVAHATHPDNEPPIKYCRLQDPDPQEEIGGYWEDDFQKSDCRCARGYALVNEICKECESGFYKRSPGNKEPCGRCPAHSVSLPGYTYKCECVEGYQRADEDNVDQACIEPPDPPLEIFITEAKKTSITFSVPAPAEGLDYKIRVAKKVPDGDIYDVETRLEHDDDIYTVYDLEPGQEYIINFNLRNGSVFSDPVTFYKSTASEPEPIPTEYLAIMIVLGSIVVLGVVGGSVCLCRRRRRQNRMFKFGENCRDPMLEQGKIGTISTIRSGSLQHRKYVPVSKYADPQDALRNARTLDSSHISLERVCGQGQFGEVWKGTYTFPGNKSKAIAAKVLKGDSSMDQKREFLAEAAIMVQFDHPHVIELVGVVTMGKIMIVTEYMKNGCLKRYLEEIRGRLQVQQLLTMARGIITGMKYLAEMNFIHRDLAARNILVDEVGVCKVSDFGLSRILEDDSQYYKPLTGKVPVRWTAPEAIVHCKYTQKSDVYSMGVVLWEMFTWGKEPWGNVSNDQVLHFLKERVKLPKPEGCPDVVYNIMLECWENDFEKRPTFLMLHNTFDGLILIGSIDRNSSFPSLMEQFNSNCSNNSDEQFLSVSKWLQGMGLSQYESHFINTGWDTIDKVVLMNEEELTKIGVTLAGHQKKIKTALEQIKSYTISSSHHFAFPGLSPESSLPRYNTLPQHGPHTSPSCLPRFGTMT